MFLDEVPEGVPDAIFGLQSAFLADPRQEKVTLIVGTYKDAYLKGTEFFSVHEAKKRLLLKEARTDYLPIDGLAEFCSLIGSICFGDLWPKIQNRTYSAQSLGGTGALRMGAEFVVQEVSRKVAIPQPTWANHRSVFERAGCTLTDLPYYNSTLHSFDREAYLAALRKLPQKCVVLFHAVCHNPTGSDPTIEDWRAISDLCKEHELFPFFDFAYQGFGEGIEKDGDVLRLFLEAGHEMIVAYSCSKNFGLYCQRVGALFVVAKETAVKEKVGSQIKRIIRASYSNPPAYGAMIVTEVLSDPDLKAEWVKELTGMRHRIGTMREYLVKSLREKLGVGRFDFVEHHKGMFSYLDLTKRQVDRLREDFGIYTLDSGRINLAGLNERNINTFVDHLLKVSK